MLPMGFPIMKIFLLGRTVSFAVDVPNVHFIVAVEQTKESLAAPSLLSPTSCPGKSFCTSFDPPFS